MGTSPQFAANPIGMPVDSEQILAVRKAGASLAEIHRCAYAGEFLPSEPIDMRFPLDDSRAPL